MTLEKRLQKLQTVYNKYALFWEKWTDTTLCILDEDQKHLVNVHVLNKFIVKIEDLIMFYNDSKKIDFEVKKLKKNYAQFQEWAILNFQMSVLKLADLKSPFQYYKTKISLLSISKILQEYLHSFGIKTINELFKKYSEDDFKSPELFRLVIQTCKILESEKYSSLKKSGKLLSV